MKKVFLFIAAAALTLAACEKKPVIPIDPDDPTDKPTPEVPDVGFKEKTFKVDVVLTKDVTTNYGGVVAEIPGDDILDFLGLTANEFYAGFGTITGTGTGGDADLQRSQENNTIMFGVADANNTDDLKWNPATAGNCGQYFKKNGSVTYWSDTEAWFFILNNTSWGEEAPEAETLAEMWTWTVGIREGNYDGSLDPLKATQVFFYTDDDDVERYAYVEWNIKIVEGEKIDIVTAGTQEINLTLDYDGKYLHTPIEDQFNTSAIKSAIGIEYTDASVYAVNADGTFGTVPGRNFWFTKEGNIGGWGEGAGIDIQNNEYPEGAPVWCVCNFPDPSLIGTTVYGAIAFVNPDNGKAYVVKVTVTFNSIEEVTPIDAAKMHDATIAVNVTVNSAEGAGDDTVAAQILDAFQLKAEDVSLAILANQISAKAYVGETEADHSTADFEIVGHWFDVNGNVIEFGDKVGETEENARSYYAGLDSDLTPSVGFYDSNMAGVNGKTIDTYKEVITFTTGEKTATVTLNWTIVFDIKAE